jgi:hypothetical protein
MNPSMKRGVLGLVLVGLLAVGLCFALQPEAQEIERGDEAETVVSDEDLALYIDVYAAMQNDHNLTIEQALDRVAHGMSLPQFRRLERRIQREERLVERVRSALLEQAKSRASSLGAVPQVETE